MGSSPKKPDVSTMELQAEMAAQPVPMSKVVAVASVAAGIQFGWALQLSLMTPYIQLLGVPHEWSSFIWLCGPISGMVVQPIVGYYSDHSTSRFGRRKPFIFIGALAVAVAVFLIGFAADIGHSLGDDLSKKTRPRAVGFFVIGFWILDVANNMLQGPCRAFLGDLSGGSEKKTRTANALFSFFMAVGNVLGYSAGSYDKLHNLFPFSQTQACDKFCANLKSCFFFSIMLLLVLSGFALFYVEDKQMSPSRVVDGDEEEKAGPGCLGQIVKALRELKKPMWLLMLVTALNWIGWFPFFLFNTDWMGKEVYGGNVGDQNYDAGVRAGSLGLMINAVVLAVSSLGVEPAGNIMGGSKNLWGIVNFILAAGLGFTVLITKSAEKERRLALEYVKPSASVRSSALAFFAVLGIPLAVNFSVPFALASIYSSATGAGQGLSLGVLNLAIVVPQMFVSALAGQWDQMFGGGNLPAFVAGAVAAAVSGILAIVLLPSAKESELAAKPKLTLAGSFH